MVSALTELRIPFNRASGRCPVTEDVTDRLVRLPFFTSMTDSEQDEVIETVLAFA